MALNKQDLINGFCKAGINKGDEIEVHSSLSSFGYVDGGAGSMIVNIIWLILTGLVMAVGYVLHGAFLCCTIIGIPFGMQMFKLAKLALMPFGAEVKYE